jgi:uncharacterized protein (DUF58 family)
MKPKIAFWVLLILFIGVIVFHSYLKDRAIERTIYFIGTIIIVNYLIAKTSTFGISFSRTSRENRQQVGQVFKERYEVINKHFFPKFWIILEDMSDVNKKPEKRLLSWLIAGSKTSFIVQTSLTKRGEYLLGPTEIRAGDPFGLFEQRIHFSTNDKLIIIPSYEKLKFFPEPSGYLTGGKAQKTRRTEVSPYAVSVRDYYPGDPLRRIDWKTSARFDKIMVKEFEQDPQASLWVYLDGNEDVREINAETDEIESKTEFLIRSEQKKENILPGDTFEYEVSFTASICDYYLQQGKTVGFSANCQQFIQLAPERGERQLSKILDSLALLVPYSKVKFQEFLLSQSSYIPKGSSVILITSSCHPDLVLSVEKLLKRSINVLFVSINPEGFAQGNSSEELTKKLETLGVKTFVININERLSNKIFESTPLDPLNRFGKNINST